LHYSHLIMAAHASLVRGLPAGYGMVADLDAAMSNCQEGFAQLFEGVGVVAGSPLHRACVALGCEKIDAGRHSNHATSSMVSSKGGAEVAALRARLRKLLPAAAWFRKHVEPLRAQMGYGRAGARDGEEQRIAMNGKQTGGGRCAWPLAAV